MRKSVTGFFLIIFSLIISAEIISAKNIIDAGLISEFSTGEYKLQDNNICEADTLNRAGCEALFKKTESEESDSGDIEERIAAWKTVIAAFTNDDSDSAFSFHEDYKKASEYLRKWETKKNTGEGTHKPGILSVLVKPAEADGAEIYIDNLLKGHSPLELSLKAGSYTVKAKQAGFLENSMNIEVFEGVRNSIIFNLVKSDIGEVKTTEKWSRLKWISLGTGIIAGTISGYYKYKADNSYNSYKDTRNPVDAASFRNKTENNTTISKTALYVASAAAASALISWIIELCN